MSPGSGHDAPWRPPAPPLFLITRPAPQDAALARRLALRGWAPVCAPLTALRPLAATPDLDGAAGLIFTSANGVRCARLPAAARALPAFCVGPATAAAAREAGFDTRTGPADAAALAQLILSDPPSGALVHLRGRHGAGGLAEALSAAGIPLREAVVYEMEEAETLPAAARDAILSGALRGAGFYSPRAARIFAERIRSAPALAQGLGGATAVAISAAAAAPLAGLGFAGIVTPPRPDGPAMEAAIDAAPQSPASVKAGLAPGR